MRAKHLFVNEDTEPRFLAYATGCILGNLSALAANSVWLNWPIGWPLLLAATLLALYGVFSIESVVEGCVVSLVAGVPLIVLLWLKPEFTLTKQIWLGAVIGLFAGKMWIGVIR